MKTTLKEKVLQFVEQRGSASFTEIQRFIVDNKFGKGTYDNTRTPIMRWTASGGSVDTGRTQNPYRGYHSTSFWDGGRWSKPGYFLTGPDHLVKGEDGHWRVVRTTKSKVVPTETKNTGMINLYKVDETTGKVDRIQYPKSDKSWISNPNIFNHEFSAEKYAEYIKKEYAAKALAEDESYIALKESESKEDLNLYDAITTLLPIKIGQEILAIEKGEGYNIRIYKTIVTNVILYVNENNPTYNVITSTGKSFAGKDLGKKFFTDKQYCLEALNELL